MLVIFTVPDLSHTNAFVPLLCRRPEQLIPNSSHGSGCIFDPQSCRPHNFIVQFMCLTLNDLFESPEMYHSVTIVKTTMQKPKPTCNVFKTASQITFRDLNHGGQIFMVGLQAFRVTYRT